MLGFALHAVAGRCLNLLCQIFADGSMCLFLTFDCFRIVRNASCVLEFPFTAVLGILSQSGLMFIGLLVVGLI